MNNNNECIQDLEAYCSQRNNSLSLDNLREKITQISKPALACSHFLHELCLNEHLTCEIIELVLQVNPYAAYCCSNRYHGVEYCDEDVDQYEAEHNNEGSTNSSTAGGSSNNVNVIRSDKFKCMPIHLACINEHCPNSVVELLAKSNPSALGHRCPIHEDLFPLYSHQVDIGEYIEEGGSLTNHEDDDGSEQLPIHVLITHSEIGTFYDIVKYIVEVHPFTLEFFDEYSQVPLHLACYSPHSTADIIQLLVDSWRGATETKDCNGYLPIHHLCENQEQEENVKLNMIRILIDASPNSVHTMGGSNDNYLPLHIAAKFQEPAFCELLINAHPESLEVGGETPFHLACESGSINTVKYLQGKQPDSIKTATGYGYNDLHMALKTQGRYQSEVVQFLLGHDPNLALQSFPYVRTKDRPGRIPLKLACDRHWQG